VSAAAAAPHAVNCMLQTARTAMAFWSGNAAQRCYLKWRRYVVRQREKQEQLGMVRSESTHNAAV